MADPILAMIGALTLAFFAVVAVVSLISVAVEAGMAIGRKLKRVLR